MSTAHQLQNALLGTATRLGRGVDGEPELSSLLRHIVGAGRGSEKNAALPHFLLKSAVSRNAVQPGSPNDRSNFVGS